MKEEADAKWMKEQKYREKERKVGVVDDERGGGDAKLEEGRNKR